MLKIKRSRLAKLENDYPGTIADIDSFQKKDLPSCPRCKSWNTASVQGGMVGRAIAICAATTKFKLDPKAPGKYFCNDCEKYFPLPGKMQSTQKNNGTVLTMNPGESWGSFNSRVTRSFQEAGLLTRRKT